MTRALRRFLTLSFRDKLLLAWVLCLHLVVVVGMRLISFRSLCRVLKIVSRGGALLTRYGARDSRKRLICGSLWAVRLINKHPVLRASCLAQVLTAQCLLRHFDIPTEAYFGIKRDGHGGLRAHAWLQSGERILLNSIDRVGWIPFNRGVGL
jgi:hypothetical protein